MEATCGVGTIKGFIFIGPILLCYSVACASYGVHCSADYEDRSKDWSSIDSIAEIT